MAETSKSMYTDLASEIVYKLIDKLGIPFHGKLFEAKELIEKLLEEEFASSIQIDHKTLIIFKPDGDIHKTYNLVQSDLQKDTCDHPKLMNAEHHQHSGARYKLATTCSDCGADVSHLNLCYKQFI